MQTQHYIRIWWLVQSRSRDLLDKYRFLKSHKCSAPFSSFKKYFSLISGPKQGSDKIKLAAGRTTFPFCFGLPPNLPSSFEGAHGYVRYFVKAIIDKPWKFDYTFKRPFTVIGILDLNADANAVVTFKMSIFFISENYLDYFLRRFIFKQVAVKTE